MVKCAMKSTRPAPSLGITIRYMLALSLVAVLCYVNYRLMQDQIANSKASRAFVDAAMHQQTLLLKNVWLGQSLIDASTLEQRSAARRHLLESVAELENAHQRLLKPEVDPGLTGSLNRQTQQFIREARALAAAPEADLNAQNVHLKNLRDAASETRLLAALDTLLADYKANSAAAVRRLERQQMWDLYATLMVLAGMAVLVFRPMKQRIQYEMTKLQEAEAYSRAIVETASDGILAVDEGDFIESANPAAEKIFGCHVKELVGRKARTLFPWPCVDAASEVEAQRLDGVKFPMEIAVSMARLSDREVSIAVVRDITERKRLENAKLQAERLAMIGTMTAKVAHEIRNPLGSIKLNLDLVRKEIDRLSATSQHAPKESRELIDALRAEAGRIQRVIEEYLQFARLPKPKPQPVVLNELLDRKLGFLQASFDEAKVRLRREFDPHTPDVLADEEQLWQAVLNLIRNALDAMPGGGTLTVRTHAESRYAELQIADTGEGMTAEQVRQLFVPFFSTKSNGTGLGLAMAQQIVAEHGGRIECTSVVGEGTTFTLRLPLNGEAKHDKET
jgi:two-component system, sporulation sensor kinase E